MKSRVIIFPTDTVYGIGTPLYDNEGIKRIYQIKGRDFNKPLAVLVSDLASCSDFVIVNENAKKLAAAFWPGALTIILPTTAKYQNITNEKSLGIRVPNHPIALELINKYGPLKTTSVNLSGKAELNDYDSIVKLFSNQVDKIYPNDQDLSKTSSTVVDLTCDNVKILRQGTISLEMINKTLLR